MHTLAHFRINANIFCTDDICNLAFYTECLALIAVYMFASSVIEKYKRYILPISSNFWKAHFNYIVCFLGNSFIITFIFNIERTVEESITVIFQLVPAVYTRSLYAKPLHEVNTLVRLIHKYDFQKKRHKCY